MCVAAMVGEIISLHPFVSSPTIHLCNLEWSFWGCSWLRHVKDLAHQEEVNRVLARRVQGMWIPEKSCVRLKKRR
jgi:hypothetical protein